MAAAMEPGGSLAAAIGPIVTSLDHYWLDSGSLLGLVRSGSLIGWDSDIDLGVWEDEIPRIEAALPALRARGLKISSRRYRGQIYGYSIDHPNRTLLPVHIHVFFRRGDIAWSPQTVAYAQHDRANLTSGFTGSAHLRPLLWHIKSGALYERGGTMIQRAVRKLVYLPIWAGVVGFRNLLPRHLWSSVWPLSAMYATYTWMIPAKYLDTLTMVPHEGMSISIPVQAESYLARRYGDWRTPQRDWCYWTDDGCIVPQPPETALLASGAADAAAS